MMNPLFLYNTLTRKKEVFQPIDPSCVRMYVCGPTVYNFAHIGNARPVIIFDVLFRLLLYMYGSDHVVYIRNITDIDDKINQRACALYPDLPPNEAIRILTEQTNQQFQFDMEALGNLVPTSQPRATDHIGAMISLIERLVSLGFAYVADNHVFFSPTAMNQSSLAPEYGSLSRRFLHSVREKDAEEKIASKRNEEDFVLWKPSSAFEPGWPSPAGISIHGRPGWHIECSAMAMEHLLVPFGGGLSSQDPSKNVFDIHGGGIDLLFPHHENEMAQTCCALSSSSLANIWMHNGFLQVEGKKMSKSEGNFITVDDLLCSSNFGRRSWFGDHVRLVMLKTRYQDPIDFTVRKLFEARQNIMDWRRDCHLITQPSAEQPDPDPHFLDCLKNDLNTPEAIQRLHELSHLARTNVEMAHIFFASLKFLGFSIFGNGLGNVSRISIQRIEENIRKRNVYIKEKNWAEADFIRQQLLFYGVRLNDTKDKETGERSTTWERVET